MSIVEHQNQYTGESDETKATFNLRDVPKIATRYLADVLDLKKGVDAPAVIKEVGKNKSLAGANAWMLMCSIVIASIGLSQNSQAVIIGAMLISPLMAPILGMGMSVGINDMPMLRSSLGHYLISIIIALFSSFAYFTLTPFDDMTSEIVARTNPTFLDIFIAIFGGIAGIISIARKDLSTTLPGVAIATALMPPLCVTGFGLATQNYEVAYRSFYLFILNTFFVALSTYLIVRLLRFPYHQYPNRKSRMKNRLLMFAFSMALAIPSLKIFQGVFRDFQLDKSFKTFKEQCFGDDEVFIDSYEVDHINHQLYLKVYGDQINALQSPIYLECLSQCGIDDYQLTIIPTSDVRIGDVEGLQKDVATINKQLEQNKIAQATNEQKVSYYESIQIDTSEFTQIKDEVLSIYPELEHFGLAKMHFAYGDSTNYNQPVAITKWNGRKSRREETEQLERFLSTRLDYPNLQVIHEK